MCEELKLTTVAYELTYPSLLIHWCMHLSLVKVKICSYI